jgi:hypothetical protein
MSRLITALRVKENSMQSQGAVAARLAMINGGKVMEPRLTGTSRQRARAERDDLVGPGAIAGPH